MDTYTCIFGLQMVIIFIHTITNIIIVSLLLFVRYHKAHLTRRLILDCSTDNDLEENMVEWLRVRNYVVKLLSLLSFLFDRGV